VDGDDDEDDDDLYYFDVPDLDKPESYDRQEESQQRNALLTEWWNVIMTLVLLQWFRNNTPLSQKSNNLKQTKCLSPLSTDSLGDDEDDDSVSVPCL